MAIFRNKARLKRKTRIRKKIFGTSGCPRLSVFRSQRHIYAQIIDDSQGKTLVSASTMEKTHTNKNQDKSAAQIVGSRLAERAQQVQVQKVIFDRNGFLYHGRIKALADAAREGGLKF